MMEANFNTSVTIKTHNPCLFGTLIFDYAANKMQCAKNRSY